MLLCLQKGHHARGADRVSYHISVHRVHGWESFANHHGADFLYRCGNDADLWSCESDLVGKSDSDDDIHDGVRDGDLASGGFPSLSYADALHLFDASDDVVIGDGLDMSHHFRKSLDDCSYKNPCLFLLSLGGHDHGL